MPNQDDIMSVTQIMTELKVSRATVHRRVKEGRLTPLNTTPALYRQSKMLFRRSEVDRLRNGHDTGHDTDEGRADPHQGNSDIVKVQSSAVA